MNEPKLFAVYLDIRADRCNIELHDVVFVVGHALNKPILLLPKNVLGIWIISL